MRIGLNLLFLLPSIVGGTETYASSLIAAILQEDQTNQYFLFLNQESKNLPFPEQKNIQKIVCPIKATNRVARFLWEQLALPWQAFAWKLDVLHSLGYICPLILSCKSVVTIHDLNFLSIPESFTPFTRLIQKLFVTGSAERADQIIVVSDYMRGQLSAYLKNTASKIAVIHEAPKTCEQADGVPDGWEELKQRFSLQKPYIFAFSSIAPHKNIPRLMEAYAKIKQAGYDCQLLIVGHRPPNGTSYSAFAQTLGLTEKEVIFTGFLPDPWAQVLLAHSTVFAFPSLYEGFGLPALEAMTAGTAVACSNRGSLPEVAGDAALYFNPDSVEEMASCILAIMQDEQTRKLLIGNGQRNLARFSWRTAARKTLAVYRKMYTQNAKSISFVKE